MGRCVKRVPVDFDWPLDKVWDGFLMPDRLDESPCPDCKGGYSPHAQYLRNLWYGNVPFHPEDNGSSPLSWTTPGVHAFASRNVANSPAFYGSDADAVEREGRRLARLWNGMWSHHLNDDDVAALVEGGRLMDLTHTWSPETRWQKIDPPVVPSAAEVNEWSLRGMGHDGINASIAMQARCERDGHRYTCATCDGYGSHEAYPGQRAEAEAWEPDEPPTGDGWQLWETVSEGSPISPVFLDAEGLAQWLTSPASCWGATRRPMTIDQARGFVEAGWAPSMIGNAGGLHDGATYVGTEKALSGSGQDGTP